MPHCKRKDDEEEKNKKTKQMSTADANRTRNVTKVFN
jgi:hypothetical protein